MTRWIGVTAVLCLVTVAVGVPPSRASRSIWTGETAMRPAGGRLAAGGGHTCMVNGDGTVRCWGNNAEGQLGDASQTNRLIPVPVFNPDFLGMVAVVAGLFHTCELVGGSTVIGGVRCWGDNSAGQLGNGFIGGEIDTPDTVEDAPFFDGDPRALVHVVAVAAGDFHTCGLLVDGTVRCWGGNTEGQLGDGTTTNRGRADVAVKNLFGIVALAAGAFHTCALRVDGQAFCWGYNAQGQLGDGTTVRRLTPVPVLAALLSPAIDLAAGGHHTCGLRADGQVLCWGRNTDGEVGDGTTTARSQPTPVSSLTSVAALAAGDRHTCALRADGQLFCWGNNAQGQLGDGTHTDRPLPGLVSGLSHIVAVAAGVHHTCALQADDQPLCWGDNSSGQLGNRSAMDSPTPTVVVGGRGSIPGRGVWASASHTCARRANGTAACWGDNVFGQLGDGTTTDRPESTPVRDLTHTVALAASFSHTCALRADGTVACWGAHFTGQLGTGPGGGQLTPVPVSGLSHIVALATAAGGAHTCALRADGQAFCWGANIFGQLGDGTTTSRSTPVPVSGLTNIMALAVGDAHTCALLGNGTAACWGRNVRGQLGDGTTTGRSTPVPVSGLSSTVALAAGDDHTCALLFNGRVRCWGANTQGQLGDNTTTDRLTPATFVLFDTFLPSVSPLEEVAALAAGDFYTCALRTDADFTCWGANNVGQLGDGTFTGRPIACITPDCDFSSARSVGLAAGETHACALSSQGKPLCWGNNAEGQLGFALPGTASYYPAYPFPGAVPSFSFNIDPLAALRAPGRQVTLTALAQCPADQRVKIQVSLTQGETVGKGSTVGACTGRLDPYPVHVSAQGPTRFLPGAAQAEATAHIRDRGTVVDTQEWTRAVTLQSQ